MPNRRLTAVRLAHVKWFGVVIALSTMGCTPSVGDKTTPSHPATPDAGKAEVAQQPVLSELAVSFQACAEQELAGDGCCEFADGLWILASAPCDSICPCQPGFQPSDPLPDLCDGGSRVTCESAAPATCSPEFTIPAEADAACPAKAPFHCGGAVTGFCTDCPCPNLEDAPEGNICHFEAAQPLLCEDDSDCCSGFCLPQVVNQALVSVCAELCLECPGHLQCELVNSPGTDPFILCVDPHVDLFTRCAGDIDCTAGARCSELGCCMTPCDGDFFGACPDGFACKELGEEGERLCISDSAGPWCMEP